jgi:thiol-disulfide isomerase/thioredoxin
MTNRLASFRYNEKLVYFFILIAVLSSHLSWAQNSTTLPCTEFSLNIKKEGGKSDTVRLFYPDCAANGFDTILVLNGPVTYRGTVERATEAILYTDIRYRYLDGPPVIRFIIEPGPINLSFSLQHDTVRNLKITGSISQTEKENWETANAALFDPHYRGSLDSLYEKRTAAVIVYIKAHPDSYFSGLLLDHYKRRMPLDSAQVYYTGLTARVKQSWIGKSILNELFVLSGDMNFRKQNSDPAFFSQLEKIKSFHDLSLPDITGRVHHLSTLKGKYVVVDFWGSWCGPCFENIPHLNNLVAAMKGKPVSFVSIAIDKDVNKWKRAMAKHHFPGLNLVDTAGLAASYYNVPWVPKYVIIKPDGSIANGDAPDPISGKLQPLLLSIINKKE